MERFLRLCIFPIALIGFLLQADSFVNRTHAGDLTPQQRLAVVLEGIQSPHEIIDICSENGISVETYNEWKEQLMSSADQIYGDPSERGIVIRDNIEESVTMESRTRAIGPGSDVFTEEITDITDDESWKVHTSFKLWAARWTDRSNFGDEAFPFKDWSVMVGPSVSLSKGKHALSMSLLAPLQVWRDRADRYEIAGVEGEFLTDDHENYYIGDIRYHTSVNENLSWFFGYKVSYTSWRNVNSFYRNGVPSPDSTGKGNEWQHGPTLGATISIPIETAGIPLSVWGSFASAPFTISQSRNIVRSDVTSEEFDHQTKTDFDAWYLNPEVGVRKSITKNSSLNLSYRYDIWGNYDAGPWVMIGGPSITYSIKW